MWVLYDALRYACLAVPVVAAWLWSTLVTHNDTVWCATLAHAIKRAGPFWIKLGQWLVHRRDVLPPALVPHLQRLQHAAPQHAFAVTRALVEQAYGDRPLYTLFATFHAHPLASGTIAQVHEGTLHADDHGVGQRIVVKVRHPGVQERFRRDVRLLRTALWVAQRLGCLRGTIATAVCDAVHDPDFERDLLAQCDLRTEADHVARLQQVFATNALVNVPTVLHATDSVLVETWVNGVYATDVHDARTRRTCHRLAMAAYLHMVLVAGVVHADMHGGNVLYDCTPSPQRALPRIGLVDFGAVLELQPAARASLRALFESLLRHDDAAIVDAVRGLIVHHGRVTDRDHIQRACADFECMFVEFDHMSAQQGGRCLSASTMVRAALRTFERNQLRVDATIVRLLVNIMLIDDTYESQRAHDNTIENALKFVFYDDEHGDFGDLTEVVLRTFGRDTVPQAHVVEEVSLIAVAASSDPQRPPLHSKRRRRRV